MRLLRGAISVGAIAFLYVREIAAATVSPTPTPTSVFCTATKCKNGGSCKIGDTKCACVDGYSGRTCKTPSPTQSPTPSSTVKPTSVFCTKTKCKNGGKCTVGSTSCTCPSGWTDRTCSTSALPLCLQSQYILPYIDPVCSCAAPGTVVIKPGDNINFPTQGTYCAWPAPNARACTDSEIITVAGPQLPSCNCPKEKLFYYFYDDSLHCGAPLCKHGEGMYFGCDCSQGHEVGQNEASPAFIDICAYDAEPNAALCTPAQKIYAAADNPCAAACQCPSSKLTIKYGTPVQCGGPKCAYGQPISKYPSACDCSTGKIYTASNGTRYCLYDPPPSTITTQCAPGDVIYDYYPHCKCPIDKIVLYWTGFQIACS